jgi:hypothetical protein
MERLEFVSHCVKRRVSGSTAKWPNEKCQKNQYHQNWFQSVPRPKIGFHAPIKGGLHNALVVARDVGCDTVQLFSRANLAVGGQAANRSGRFTVQRLDD